MKEKNVSGILIRPTNPMLPAIRAFGQATQQIVMPLHIGLNIGFVIVLYTKLTDQLELFYPGFFSKLAIQGLFRRFTLLYSAPWETPGARRFIGKRTD